VSDGDGSKDRDGSEESLEELARTAGLGDAGGAGARPHSTARLGDVAAELERQLQSDRRADIPDEPILRSGPVWGRWVKRTMYDTLRPITRRYDRICASLATLTTSTAERLEALEAEVARLRRQVEGPKPPSASSDDDGGGGGGGDGDAPGA
jgi:hypothetical protein